MPGRPAAVPIHDKGVLAIARMVYRPSSTEFTTKSVAAAQDSLVLTHYKRLDSHMAHSERRLA